MTDIKPDKDAELYIAAHARETGSREAWIEAILDEAELLHRKRHELGSNNAFGDWLDANGVKDLHNKDDRAALIDLGANLPLAREVLQDTKRTSLQHIWTNEASRRFLQVKKTPAGDDDANNEGTDTVSQRNSKEREVEAYVKALGTQGITSVEAKPIFGGNQQIFDLKRKPGHVLVATGEKRDKAEVLVHRDFATAEMKLKAKGKGVATGKGKPRKPAAPIQRDARPLYLMDVKPREVTGYPSPETAQEIDPETGLTKAMAFVRKYGHAQNMPKKERDLLDAHQVAVRLAPALRDLTKELAGFLRTPAPQADDIVPMDPIAFVAAAQELKDGQFLRSKVEKELADLEPVLAAVNDYVTALKTALAAPPVKEQVA